MVMEFSTPTPMDYKNNKEKSTSDQHGHWSSMNQFPEITTRSTLTFPFSTKPPHQIQPEDSQFSLTARKGEVLSLIHI